MPLGNLTSQFFANVYLTKFDYFAKQKLKVKYYIRYVDDFVIFHNSQKQLQIWKEEIDKFLREELKIELHKDKTRIIPLKRGIDFVGFRNFYHHRLLRKRNINSMSGKVKSYRKGKRCFENIFETYKGWHAYAMWGDTHKQCERMKRKIIDVLLERI